MDLLSYALSRKMLEHISGGGCYEVFDWQEVSDLTNAVSGIMALSEESGRADYKIVVERDFEDADPASDMIGLLFVDPVARAFEAGKLPYIIIFEGQPGAFAQVQSCRDAGGNMINGRWTALFRIIDDAEEDGLIITKVYDVSITLEYNRLRDVRFVASSEYHIAQPIID